MQRYYQLSAQGVLHKMEAGHAGAGASNPIKAELVTLSKYELCDLPSCFGGGKYEASSAEVGGELAANATSSGKDATEDAEEGVTTPFSKVKANRKRVAHGVTAEE